MKQENLINYDFDIQTWKILRGSLDDDDVGLMRTSALQGMRGSNYAGSPNSYKFFSETKLCLLPGNQGSLFLTTQLRH
jgi:hypothetical protein